MHESDSEDVYNVTKIKRIRFCKNINQYRIIFAGYYDAENSTLQHFKT